MVKSIAETIAWRSHCQFITFITFLVTVNVMESSVVNAAHRTLNHFKWLKVKIKLQDNSPSQTTNLGSWF